VGWLRRGCVHAASSHYLNRSKKTIDWQVKVTLDAKLVVQVSLASITPEKHYYSVLFR
jgi:hypothetical protein